ncbi:SDR family NAD(P)-dependent oxidoreductase [Nocardioides humi]|uniref:SDR family NAD(P)-dependent oxidoreductase n=1 Tax=Nocardioides humi TaxID=449461 RepID=A0ABN2ADG3_9ACTN|nr:SDR family NAD(P)-dependent oxidoreductase [Nocardioides humi]
MTARLSGLSLLVTGGGSGIGRAVVDAFVAEGGHVTVVEYDDERASDVAAAHGDAVEAMVGDAGDPKVLAAAVEAASRRGSLDHLACIVGSFDFYQSILDLDADRLERAAMEIWRRNVLSALLAIRAAHDHLSRARGSITLTVSGAAYRAEGGGVLYGSSKAALHGVVVHLASELAPRVRVNGVAPGGTAQTRLGGLASLDQRTTTAEVAGRDERIRAGTALGVLPLPADHAPAYVHLADPVASRVVTGTVMRTDGGRQ